MISNIYQCFSCIIFIIIDKNASLYFHRTNDHNHTKDTVSPPSICYKFSESSERRATFSDSAMIGKNNHTTSAFLPMVSAHE